MRSSHSRNHFVFHLKSPLSHSLSLILCLSLSLFLSLSVSLSLSFFLSFFLSLCCSPSQSCHSPLPYYKARDRLPNPMDEAGLQLSLGPIPPSAVIGPYS